MHLTLKLETTKPAGNNFLQQQANLVCACAPMETYVKAAE
jgi:hypothetical protein